MRLLEGSKMMTTQLDTPLFQALMNHVKQEPISFHVPGHKYGQIPLPDEEAAIFYKKILQIDATELSGLDDLHSPEGPILEAETLLSQLFKTEKSYFLINGSTVGNLTMIMATCKEDDIVLVQRNCHKSILNALKLAKAHPVFLEPEYNQDWEVASGLCVETVKEAITNYPEARALVLTYPNYYGMVYDLRTIIKLAHRHQIPVLVDEAHGPHFIIGDPFPASAVQLGADIVVQSAHKTLPAMTMGSFLHVNSQLVSKTKVKDYLEIYQSSSPSYPIMASLDLARKYIATFTEEDVSNFMTKVARFKEHLAQISTIKVLNFPNSQGDHLRITIQSRCGLSGFQIQQRLEHVGLFTELADPANVLFVLPLLKGEDTYKLDDVVMKMKAALDDFKDPGTFRKREKPVSNVKFSELAIPYKEMTDLLDQDVPLEKAEGHICAEMIIPYPPGIPLFLKGERVTVEKLNQLHHLMVSGARFQGGTGIKNGMIKVFRTTSASADWED